MKTIIIATFICLMGLNTMNGEGTERHFKIKKIQAKEYLLLNSILKVKPKINNRFAKKVTHEIIKHSNKHGIDPFLIVAMIRQESNFEMDAKNCDKKNKKKCYDFGIIQLNHTNFKVLKINKKRLMTDIGYAIEIMCSMVSDLKGRHKKDPIYWTRYNARNYSKKIKYKKMVCRFYHGTNNHCKIKT